MNDMLAEQNDTDEQIVARLAIAKDFTSVCRHKGLVAKKLPSNTLGVAMLAEALSILRGVTVAEAYGHYIPSALALAWEISSRRTIEHMVDDPMFTEEQVDAARRSYEDSVGELGIEQHGFRPIQNFQSEN